MKIDINFANNSGTIVDFDETDYSNMWDILMSDRWYFEEYIINYLLVQLEDNNIYDEENLQDLYNKLKEYFIE